MISAISVAFTVAATIGASWGEAPLIQAGGDPGRGLLVNVSTGARPFDPPDPGRSTMVFVHGFNPLPRVVHFEMAERLAEALARRSGPNSSNVFAWDWNAATFQGVRLSRHIEASVAQGRRLAIALHQAGVDPGRLHLIGHSSGAMVTTSAARELFALTGVRVGRLTLLDPASSYHSTIFDDLAAGSLSPVVENFWSPGPSAYGKLAPRPGVRNYRVQGQSGPLGVVCPLRSDHLQLVRWYLTTVERAELPFGYNAPHN